MGMKVYTVRGERIGVFEVCITFEDAYNSAYQYAGGKHPQMHDPESTSHSVNATLELAKQVHNPVIYGLNRTAYIEAVRLVGDIKKLCKKC